MRKTKAAILAELRKPLVVDELGIPELKAGQVLVRVVLAGVCHTQLNEIDGKKGPDKYLPHVLGHEGAGVVEEVGDNVRKVKPGDHVVLTWIKGSGTDVAGSTYQWKGQTVNSGAVAAFMERAVISENRLVPIPHEMPLDEAALLGCAVPTGAGIIFNTLQCGAGSSIAVFGIGGVGISAVLAAKAAGCAEIVAVDVHDAKLDLARKVGATSTVNATQGDPVSCIRELTQGRGVDYAVEAAGFQETMEMAFAVVREGGGTAVVAGNLSHGEKITIDPFDLIKGKRILGSWGGETHPDSDIPKYVHLYLEGKLDLDCLITHRYPLDQINEAVDTLKTSNRAFRVLIEC